MNITPFLVLLCLAGTTTAATGQEIRLSPVEFDFGKASAAGAGTSGITTIQTVVLKGDPTKPGLYTILLRVPAHTKIAAHRHPDDRVATVVSGIWHFGYGSTFDATKLKPLPQVASIPSQPAKIISPRRATATL